MSDMSGITVAERDAALIAVSSGAQKCMAALPADEVTGADFQHKLALKAEALAAAASTDKIRLSCVVTEVTSGREAAGRKTMRAFWLL